jgi:hypothetical protein
MIRVLLCLTFAIAFLACGPIGKADWAPQEYWVNDSQKLIVVLPGKVAYYVKISRKADTVNGPLIKY